MIKVAIFHPSDPLGHVPGGIDTFIKGILKWSPQDIEYVLFGASSDNAERPIGQRIVVGSGPGRSSYIPIVPMQSSARRNRIPLSVRYINALISLSYRRETASVDILDFHRMEPALVFRNDPRPKNITLHADYAELREQKSDIMWRHWPWLYEQLEARAFAAIDRVYAVRQSAVDRYKKQFPEAAGKFCFTPTWVDTQTFFPLSDEDERTNWRVEMRRRLGVDVNAKLLVFVGRLDHQKDPILLLKAVREVIARHQDLHLVIVGDGILRREVEGLCRGLALENRVTLLGAQPSNQIAELLRAGDLFVLSSAYEGMPIAVLEALACGLPVVSTNVGEVPRVIVNGTNGQLCRVASVPDMADAIASALDGLITMRGAPCTKSVEPYHPEKVLGPIYDHHRAQYKRLVN